MNRLIKIVVALTVCFGSVSAYAATTPLNIDQAPLFTQSAVKPNVVLSLDDSGSMETEFIYDTQHGYLWWHGTRDSLINPSTDYPNNDGYSDGGYSYMYLFPNGGGVGERLRDNGDKKMGLPPFPQFAFARSSDFNPLYYNPEATYEPWADGSTYTFAQQTPTAAQSHPALGTSTLDLTQVLQAYSDADKRFYVHKDMVIPAKVSYNTGSGFGTSDTNVTVSNSGTLGVAYYPATYHVKVTTGEYSFKDAGGNTVSGSCGAPIADHYLKFEKAPTIAGIGTSSASDVYALAYDGSCLKKVEIDPADTAQMNNFANWFSYYRKRHFTLRAAVGTAFSGINSIRADYIMLSDPETVNMRDMASSANRLGFLDDVYSEFSTHSGTANTEAIKHIGNQYQTNNSIITSACQKNFGLFFTDGYTDDYDDFSATGYERDDESDVPRPFKGPSNTSYMSFADFAWHYYVTPLRTDLGTGKGFVNSACNDDNPSPLLDCNKDLHMNTYTIGMGALGDSIYGRTYTIDGVDYTYNKVADAHAAAAAISGAPDWPSPFSNADATQIDDFYHAAVNGRGEMYNASNAAQLKEDFTSALLNIQESKGSAAAVTFNTATLDDGTFTYQALFNSAAWNGDVRAYELNSVTGDLVDSNDSTTELDAAWSAAEELNATNYDSGREIITYDAVQQTGIPFRWSNITASGASPSMRADLESAIAVEAAAFDGEDVLNYLRGKRDDESSSDFRVRTGVLGDIINGSPVHVGKPNMGWPDAGPLFPDAVGETYSNFRVNQRDRNPMLYVGANDGMLHGFEAESGAEKLAFIPHELYSSADNEGLHYLSEVGYSHRYYVDQSPTVSDVYVDLTDDVNDDPSWKTVLVSGLGAGGRGLFALDVTNPDDFNELNASQLVLWEFTNETDADLGYTFSRPTVAMMENGRWAVITGNGYNSDAGKAKLFIIYMDGGIDGSWTKGTDYFVIDTNDEESNGLSTPVVIDTDGNGAADRAYAGDLQGNLWAFDLSSADLSEAAWGVDYSGSPLFTAIDSDDNRQPITTKPSVVYNYTETTNNSNEPNVILLFGTGKFIEAADLSDTQEQSFYGIWDQKQSSLERTDLQQQTIAEVSYDINGNVTTDPEFIAKTYRYITGSNVVGNNQYGWYMNLPRSGERVVTDAVARGKNVFFNTWIPSDDPCDAGGSGFLMSVNFAQGYNPLNPAFDVDGDGHVDAKDIIASGGTDYNPAGQIFETGLPSTSKMLGNKQYTSSTGTEDINKEGGGIRDIEDLGGPKTGRQSWQELSN